MGNAHVIPVILRPVDWHETPLSELKALPKDGKAISTWKNRDEAYLDVVRGIKEVVQEIGAEPPIPGRKPAPPRRPSGYQGSVVQVGGVGSRLVTKTAWLISEHGHLDAEDFITHWFNVGGDILSGRVPRGLSNHRLNQSNGKSRIRPR